MLFVVEGNIGAGKSTLLRRIKERYGDRVHVVQEPVDEWTSLKDGQGRSLLQLMYANPKRYAFLFQTCALETRCRRLREVLEQYNKDDVVIMERSLYSDRYVFGDLMAKRGHMSEVEHAVYCNLWNSLVGDAMAQHVVGVVYLHTRPSVALQRVDKRKRVGEEKLDEAYMREVHEQHKKWLFVDRVQHPIIVVDANKDEIDMCEIMDFVDQQAVLRQLSDSEEMVVHVARAADT